MISSMKKSILLAITISLNVVSAPNSIVAIVNDNLITYNAISADNNSKADRLAAVNHQIDIILQLDKISAFGIEPKSIAINNMLKHVASQNSLTLKQLQERPEFGEIMTNIKQSLSLNELRQYVNNKVSITLNKVEITKALGNNSPTAEELEKQIRIAQIAISSIDKTDSLLQSEDELIKTLLIDLSNQIQQGKSFSDLAKLHSQDESYKNGGESAWLIQKRLPQAFIQTLANLEMGELSKPFKVGNSWRLVKIIEKRNVDKRLTNIKAALILQKKDAYFSNWVKKLREAAYIEIFDHKL